MGRKRPFRSVPVGTSFFRTKYRFRPGAAGEAIVRRYGYALLSYWLIRAEAEVRDLGAPVLIQLGIEIVE